MVFLAGRFQCVRKTLPISCREFRPIVVNLRGRSTTAISSSFDDKTQQNVARDSVLTFDDSKQAFKSKTTWEIMRALTVFRLCTVDLLVDNNRKVS